MAAARNRLWARDSARRRALAGDADDKRSPARPVIKSSRPGSAETARKGGRGVSAEARLRADPWLSEGRPAAWRRPPPCEPSPATRPRTQSRRPRCPPSDRAATRPSVRECRSKGVKTPRAIARATASRRSSAFDPLWRTSVLAFAKRVDERLLERTSISRSCGHIHVFRPAVRQSFASKPIQTRTNAGRSRTGTLIEATLAIPASAGDCVER